MTPLEQELENLKRKCEQRIRMDQMDNEQAYELIERRQKRIKRNRAIIKELEKYEQERIT